jgi:hypothetical protein
MANKQMTRPRPSRPKDPLDAQEPREWHDLQNAQMSAMADIWDNPEDEVWNDLGNSASLPHPLKTRLPPTIAA